METLTDMGLEDKMKLITQPVNSPDLNINNLGFFNAPLHATCHCTTSRNAAQLIGMVEHTCSHKKHPINKINCM